MEEASAQSLTAQCVHAPVDGTVMRLEDVPDPLFASGAMGDGLAIDPTSDIICAPVTGVVIDAPSTRHSLLIRTDDGLEVLVHIGLDTIRMRGRAFTSSIAKYDKVTCGEELVKVDWQAITDDGHPTCVIVVLSNSDAFPDVKLTDAATVAVEDEIIRV